MTPDRFSPFAHGVSALDDALIAEPVFATERGLTRRRERLERTFAKALRAYLEEVKARVGPDEVLVDVLLAELPEVK